MSLLHAGLDLVIADTPAPPTIRLQAYNLIEESGGAILRYAQADGAVPPLKPMSTALDQKFVETQVA
jgi:hypothetical protein